MIANGSLKYKELLDEQSVIVDYEEDYKSLGSALKKTSRCHIATLSNFYQPTSDPHDQHEHFQQLLGLL